MKAERGTEKDELNLHDVTRLLNIDYNKLAKEGQVDQLLQNGITKALPVQVKIDIADKKGVTIDTTARLAMGRDKNGNQAVQVVFKNDTPQLQKYKDVVLSTEQQNQLRKGNTVVITDGKQSEHLVKFDGELNRLAGMKKSIFLVPEKIGSPKEGYATLSTAQQSSLKRGEAVELEIGGKKMTAQLDPIERKLNVQQSPKESLDLKLTGPQRKTGPSL